jgi:hypothetical protein
VISVVENESMAIKILCIQNGIPLWSSTYPDNHEEENSSLIGGFLSAINTFATMTEGKPIKNMTIGNSLWTFVNVHGIQDFFITSEIDTIGEIESKNYKIRLIEQLVSEILEEFTKNFSPESINANPGSVARYSEIQAYAARKTKACYEIMERYEKHDIKWLSDFKESERLFTGIMDNVPIFVTGDSIQRNAQTSELVKLQATIEFISGRPIEYKQFSSIHSSPSGRYLQELIVCTSQEDVKKLLTGSTVVIDIDLKRVLNGPEPNSVALRTVTLIRNYSSDKQGSMNVLSSTLSKDDNQVPGFQNLISDKQPMLTEVNCKLCNTPLKFNINDDSSYLDKKAHQSFFGMDLTTYRVAHLSQDQMHVNSVLVDNKGLSHGLIETLAIPFSDATKLKVNTEINGISIMHDRLEPLRQHPAIDTMFIMDMVKMTMIELVCPSFIKSAEVGRLIVDKMQEVLRVYSNTPNITSVTVADKKYEIWISGSILFAICFKKSEFLEEFDDLMKKMVDLKYSDREWFSKRERLHLMLKSVETTKMTKLNVPIMVRILSDDLIFSRIQAKYPDQVPRIVDKLNKEFLIPKEAITTLLLGKISVIDLLRGEYLSRAKELIELVDYVNRRKIVG